MSHQCASKIDVTQHINKTSATAIGEGHIIGRQQDECRPMNRCMSLLRVPKYMRSPH